MKRVRIALGAIILLGCASFLEAAPATAVNSPGTAGITKEASTPAKETTAPAQADDRLPIYKQDEWQFFLSPYIWIPGINISLNTLKNTTHTDIPWWDVASELFSKAIGVMGRAEAWKGRWGVFLDGYYTYVGSSSSQVGATKEQSFGPVDFTLDKLIHIRDITINVAVPGQIGPGNITLTPSGSIKYISRLSNLDLGVRFLVGAWPLKADKPLPVVSLELLGGPRFNSINQYMRVNLRAIRIGTAAIDIGRFTLTAKHQSIKNGSLVVDYNNQYFEPFLGARLGLWLTRKFLITLKGEAGGFGLVADDHVDCDFEGLAGYRVHKNIYLYAGYRARGSWYNLGEGLAQIMASGWVHGPVVGVTYTF
jgi:hypothetical protein